ncbi:hypothetical protein AK830_g6977 [Neonectria ditissima]|uniref:Uncharacterized protein n=1 Tax=Neonectria ditissima TaxID=78410 RepID=A0A0P7BH56_9HYPO|nr:hypothetical protein AK830_g6977 [Neonectria ditissima]
MSFVKAPQIPNIFEQALTFELVDWFKRITKSPSTYKKCYVRRFTYVKNLGVPVLHEYLNVIVEDEDTDTWTRLIVERSYPNDQVIAGRWGARNGYHERWEPDHCFYQRLTVFCSSSGSGSGGESQDLPLPLITRSFQRGTFSVIKLARLLKSIHNTQPVYSAFAYNCYWFARMIFTGVEAWGQNVKDHSWEFMDWMGSKWRVIFDVTSKAVQAAKRFVQLRAHYPLSTDSKIQLSAPDVKSAEGYDRALRDVIFTLKQFINATRADGKWIAFRNIGKEVAVSQSFKMRSPESENFEAQRLLSFPEIFLEGPTQEEIVALDDVMFFSIGRVAEEKLD